MQQYSEVFARVYNERWASFAQSVAPLIREYYEAQAGGTPDRTLLDIACGTGQLAAHFLAAGYRVVGLDIAQAMLDHARANNADAVAEGRAAFVEGDAADFTLDERFGLAVSTFDALNHLPDEAALAGAFHSAYRALRPGGLLVFDLNTRTGLHRWNGVNVQDDEDAFVLTRGIYDGGPLALTRVTSFVRGDDGRYERIAASFTNTVFEMARVRALLDAAGFAPVHFAAVQALADPVPDPEAQGRAWVVARRPV